MKIIHPKGTLIPIGGGEDKEHEKKILKRVIEETGKKSPGITLLTLASGVPEQQIVDYRNAFKSLGASHVDHLHFLNRDEADNEKHIKMIRKNEVVFMSGGDQLKLVSLLGGTQLLEEIRQKYFDHEKFVVAGTSAGAAAMSSTMIIAGQPQDALIKGRLELTNGLNLLTSVFVDTHFTERGRVGRLIQTVAANPGILGVGLGEDTSLVIRKGNRMEVVGDGLVILVDGSKILFSNLGTVDHGDPITVEQVIVHVLGNGMNFLFDERKIDPKCKEKANAAK